MDWPRPPSPPPTTSPSFDFGQQSLGMPITASSVAGPSRPETPAGSRMGIAIPPHPGRAGVSPPTPAPSPTPADKYFGRMSMRSLEQALEIDEELERGTMARRDWQLKSASVGMEEGDLSIDVMPQGESRIRLFQRVWSLTVLDCMLPSGESPLTSLFFPHSYLILLVACLMLCRISDRPSPTRLISVHCLSRQQVSTR